MTRSIASLAVLLCLATTMFPTPNAFAQPPQTRPGAGQDLGAQPVPDASQWPQVRQPGQRQGDGDGDRSVHQPPSAEYRNIQPRVRPGRPGIPAPVENWYLGIHPERAPKGVRVDRVVPGSPAHRFGLESGDYILDVGGYVVGDYQGTYYPLAMAMEFGTDAGGWAELLVWNKRTFAAETLWVRMRRR